jgi:enoyl-CoA hydratase
MALDVEIAGGVATVTMNRPEALNAFNTEQLGLMVDVLKSVRDDPAVRCVIVTGAGVRAFAAGADIKEMAAKSRDEALAFGRLGHAMTRLAETMPKPVIGAVNGFALGGGCELALACDIRLASENAVFAQPEVSLGIPPGWGGTQRLTRLVGPGLAAEMIFTGRRVRADEALRIGLVNAVHPLESLLDQARELATTIVKQSPRAVAASKLLMGLAFNGQIPAGLDTEAEMFANAFKEPDQKEGMAAFIEKRAPVFDDRGGGGRERR